ncbi:MAG: hypothetical protein II007_13520 [Gammaproteobacteria bacterium]|nr:hypothetical protein [Gammaproteobacteria bacterium]
MQDASIVAAGIYRAANPCLHLLMQKDIYAIRLANLRALIEKAGSISGFAAAVESSPSTISQILSPRTDKNLGDKLARKIEANLKLGFGWMDSEHAEAGHAETPTFASITIPITHALTPAADGITVTAESCDQGVVLLPAVSPKDYAAVITTSGLLPRIERDQVAVIAPTLPVLEGDMVLIAMASGDLLLCRWLYDRGDVRYVEPVNGGDRRELQRSAIRDCHYVAQVLNKPRQLAH